MTALSIKRGTPTSFSHTVRHEVLDAEDRVLSRGSGTFILDGIDAMDLAEAEDELSEYLTASIAPEDCWVRVTAIVESDA